MNQRGAVRACFLLLRAGDLLLGCPFQGESIFLSRVEGRGFHVEGEGTMSRVEGNIFFSIFFFFWKR